MDIKKAEGEIARLYKTSDLIKLMAKADEDWIEADIDRAIRETGAAPFSLADVRFMRDLLNDELYAAWEEQNAAMLKTMAKLPLDDRKRYFEEEYKPRWERANEYRRQFKSRYDGLVYCKE